MDLPNGKINLGLDLDLVAKKENESQDPLIVYNLKLAKKFQHINLILFIFQSMNVLYFGDFYISTLTQNYFHKNII